MTVTMTMIWRVLTCAVWVFFLLLPSFAEAALTDNGQVIGEEFVDAGEQVSATHNICIGCGEGRDDTLTVEGELITTGKIIVGEGNNNPFGPSNTGRLIITGGGKAVAAMVDLEPDPNPNSDSSGTVLVGAASELRLTALNLAVRNGLLMGSGTIRLEGGGNNVTINSGTISPGDVSGQLGTLTIQGGGLINNVNMEMRVDTAAGNKADRIDIIGGAFRNTSQNPETMRIDLSSLIPVTNAPIITTANGIVFEHAGPTSAVFTLNGLAIGSVPRLAGKTAPSLTISGNTLDLLLTSKFNAQNEKMTWTGASDTVWNMTSENWTNSDSTIKNFLAGDWAVFNSNNGPDVAKSVNASQMDVTGGTWLFEGGLIINKDIWVGSLPGGAGPDGGLHITGNADVTLRGNNVFSGGIDVAEGSLTIQKGSDYQFNDLLTGGGLLTFDMGGKRLAFGTGVGNAFTGTVALNNGNLAIDANAASVLAGSTLRLDSGAKANVDGSRNLGGLEFNGGTLNMAAFNGSGNIGPNTPLAVNTLANSGGGTVNINIGDLNGIKTDAADYNTLFDYASGGGLYQKQIVTAGSVSGDFSTLNLLDASGNDLKSGHILERGITDNIAGEVGRATFDYIAAVGAGGLYLGYGLRQVEALAAKTVTLDSSGSTGVPKLTAKLTGAGDFAFSGNKDAEIGNTASDYTGKTTINGLTVTMLTDKALGQTSELTLNNNSRLDMNGKAQTVGELNGTAGTSIHLGALTVAQNSDTVFNGLLTGSGSLSKEGNGKLTLSGSNTYTGDTVINGGTLELLGSLQSTRLAMRGGTFDFSGGTVPTSFTRLDIAGTGSALSGGPQTLDLSGETISFDLTGVSAGQTMLDAQNSLNAEGTKLELNGLDGLTLTKGERVTLIENVLGMLAALESYAAQSGTFAVLQESGNVYLELAAAAIPAIPIIRQSFLNLQNSQLGPWNNMNLVSGAGHLDWLSKQGHDMRLLESAWNQSMSLGRASAAIALEQMYGGYAAYAGAPLAASGDPFRTLWQERTAARHPGGHRLYANTFASQAEQKGAKNLAGYEWEARGLALGYEHSFNNSFKAGFGAAFSKGELAVDRLRYKNRPDIVNLALYTAYTHPGGFFARGGLAYGHAQNDYEVDMLIGGQKSGEYDSESLSASLELGWAARLPRAFNLVPSIGLEYERIENDPWQETVSGNPALIAGRFGGTTDESLALPLALSLNKNFQFGTSGYIVPQIRAAYVYQKDEPQNSISSGYSGAPGSARMVGVKPGRDHWRFGAGFVGRAGDIDFQLNYDFDTRSGFQSHSFAATVGVEF